MPTYELQNMSYTIPALRNTAACAVSNKWIYLTGGNSDNTATSINHKTYIYNIELDYWSDLNINTPIGFGGGTYTGQFIPFSAYCPTPKMLLLDTGTGNRRLLLFGGLNSAMVFGSEESSINRDIYYLEIDVNGIPINNASWIKLETISLSGTQSETNRIIMSGDLYYDVNTSIWKLIYSLARSSENSTVATDKLAIFYSVDLTGVNINQKNTIFNIHTKLGLGATNNNTNLIVLYGTYIFDTRIYFILNRHYYTNYTSINSFIQNSSILYMYDIISDTITSKVYGNDGNRVTVDLVGANNRLYMNNYSTDDNNHLYGCLINNENTATFSIPNNNKKVYNNLLCDTESLYDISGIILNSTYLQTMNKVTIKIEPPTNLTLSVSGNNPLVSWTDHSDNESDFVIERRLSTSPDWIRIATITSISISSTTQPYTYIDTEIDITTNLKVYYYRVKSRLVI